MDSLGHTSVMVMVSLTQMCKAILNMSIFRAMNARVFTVVCILVTWLPPAATSVAASTCCHQQHQKQIQARAANKALAELAMCMLLTYDVVSCVGCSNCCVDCTVNRFATHAFLSRFISGSIERVVVWHAELACLLTCS